MNDFITRCIRRRHRWLVTLPLLAASLPAPLAAFDQAGHFYTSYALVRSESQKELTLVALCTQLPDMASDLDAVAVYKTAVVHSPLAWYRWARADETGSNEDIRRMVTVQQQLHALTGGDSEAAGRAATASIRALLGPARAAVKAAAAASAPSPQATKRRAAALCALGFAYHFIGDAAAHRRLRDDTKMYGTGFGHAEDLTYPDRAMCDALHDGWRLWQHCNAYQAGSKRRFDAWMRLWGSAKDDIDLADVDPATAAARKATLQTLIESSSSASDSNDWLELDMRTKLVTHDPPASTVQAAGSDPVEDYRTFILAQKSDRSCEKVLASAFVDLKELATYGGLRCSDVWPLYSASVRQALRNEPAARKPLETGIAVDGVYMDNPLLKD